ncbi:MAG: cation diffusion facilitator family transporter [Prevotellaceae bacterium]|jgi:cation diffusion facilitator family transporter|nr:cation diffusion facilitator family transporter [Prevotellaceae bacterium]
MSQESKALGTIVWSILSNFCLAMVKAIVGIIGNSFALIADAIESTADIFSSIIVWAGLKISLKPADKSHPYGHGKIEPLATFIVVAFLITAAVVIAIHAIKNISTPHKMPAPYTLIVLTGVVIVKELAYVFINKRSKQIKSSSLKADAWHHRSDALTSLAAFIGIAIALIMGKGYENADDWAALFAVIIILYNSYLIFRPALGELLDEQQYDGLIDKIRVISTQVEGVKEIEKCYVRKFGMKFYIDIHVWVDGNMSVCEGHNIAHRLSDYIKMNFEEISGINSHIEPCGKCNNDFEK